MDPLSQGRSYYKQKDYKAALEAFTKATMITSDHMLLTALDGRAATYEKLNELQSALKDARDMIVLEPGLAKGYLRCGKVLQLTGKSHLALQIYERGLKKVKIGDDSDRPLLQKMYSKLQQKQIPKINLDPLVMLPNELALMVCEMLNTRDLVVCLAVSKPWKRFLEASHRLWTTLDLRFAKRAVRINSLGAYLRRSNYTLDRAYFNGSHSVNLEHHAQMVIRTCKQLNYLEIYSQVLSTTPLSEALILAFKNAKNLRTLVFKNCEIYTASIAAALRNCPLLETAEIYLFSYAGLDFDGHWGGLDRLTSLKLSTRAIRGNLANTMNLMDLLRCTPNLRSANITNLESGNLVPSYYTLSELDFTLWGKLEHLRFCQAKFVFPPFFPPTLKYLDLSDNAMYSMPYGDTAPSLPLLETFVCKGTTGWDLQHLSAIIGPSVEAGNLKTLHLANAGLMSAPPFDNAVFSIPSLEDLSLRGWHMPSEEQLLGLLRLLPALRRVDLSQTRVTGVAVKELMTRESGPLERLSLIDCTRLSSDAVDYARSLGTTVDYSISGNQRSRPRSFRDRLILNGI